MSTTDARSAAPGGDSRPGAAAVRRGGAWSEPEPVRGPLPPGAGIGLKPAHFREVLAYRPPLGFFEIHAENYMIDGGPFHHYLGQIRQHYALSLHGVGLSIGGSEPLDRLHLDRLAGLADRYEVACVSEHLAWSTHGQVFFNDLLPLRYDGATLQRVCDHIDQVQQRLKRRLLLENPSTYVEFRESGDGGYSETQFLGELVRRSGCALLLDVNNVHVSCVNHGRDARSYLAELPLEAVSQIHLAGFTADVDGAGDRLLIDSHAAPVDEQVWELYAWVVARLGSLPTLIEWDRNVPALKALVREAARAQAMMLPTSARMQAAGLRESCA